MTFKCFDVWENFSKNFGKRSASKRNNRITYLIEARLMGSRARTLYTYLKIKDMNKNVAIVYESVVKIVVDEFDIEQQRFLHCNEMECVQARTVLYVALHEKGLSDAEIAQCCGVLRESVNRTRNHYREAHAPWLVKLCLERIRKG